MRHCWQWDSLPGATRPRWGRRRASRAELIRRSKPERSKQLKAVVEHQQRQLEEQRQALEVQRALLQKLERKVAELSRGFSSEQRAFADKQALAAQAAPSPPREPARSAAPQPQAALAGAPSSSVPEKEPRPASITSAQNLKAYWKEGLRFDSADKSQRFRVGGRIMNDWGFFSAGDELNDAVGPVRERHGVSPLQAIRFRTHVRPGKLQGPIRLRRRKRRFQGRLHRDRQDSRSGETSGRPFQGAV